MIYLISILLIISLTYLEFQRGGAHRIHGQKNPFSKTLVRLLCASCLFTLYYIGLGLQGFDYKMILMFGYIFYAYCSGYGTWFLLGKNAADTINNARNKLYEWNDVFAESVLFVLYGSKKVFFETVLSDKLLRRYCTLGMAIRGLHFTLPILFMKLTWFSLVGFVLFPTCYWLTYEIDTYLNGKPNEIRDAEILRGLFFGTFALSLLWIL